MKQGEIWYVDLNPTKVSEQAGFRPTVIISGNLMNTYLPVVICCPLTSKIKNYKGNLILEPNKTNNLELPSEILTFHIRSISKERFVRKLGQLTKDELGIIMEGLNDILTL